MTADSQIFERQERHRPTRYLVMGLNRLLLGTLLFAAPQVVFGQAAPDSFGPEAQLIVGPGDTAHHLGPWYLQGFNDVHREVVRDSVRWKALWAQWNKPAPPVDFNREMVVVAGAGRYSHMGAGAGAGPWIKIDSVMAIYHGTVAVVLTAPCRRGAYSGFMVVANPADMVRVPRSTWRVEWLERETSFPGCIDTTSTQ